MARLRTARLTDDTLVSQIDDFTGELESDIAAILGINLDEDVTESPFLLSNAGLVTKPLLRFYNANGLSGDNDELSAYSITNDSNLNIARIGLFNRTIALRDTKIVGVQLPGSIPANDASYGGFVLALDTETSGDPFWQILGNVFDGSSPGLVPAGSGLASEYLCTDGRFHPPGHPSEAVSLKDGSGDGSAGTPVTPSYPIEVFDDNALHAANDDEIIVVNAGNFVVSADAEPSFGASGIDGYYKMQIDRNRAGVHTVWGLQSQQFSGSVSRLNCTAMIPCNAGDKLSVIIDAVHDGAVADSFSFNSLLWAARIT